MKIKKVLRIFLVILCLTLVILINKYYETLKYTIYQKKVQFINYLTGNILADYDISQIPLKKCKNKLFKGNIWLISFADSNVDGNDIHHMNQILVSASGMINCAYRIIMYKKEDIDKNFIKKNAKILNEKRGAGYWLWKPYIIKKTLDFIPEDDIIVYVDSGIRINRNLTDVIYEYLSQPQCNIVFAEHEDHLILFVKRNVFRYFNLDKKEYLYNKRYSNGLSIYRNNKWTRNFINELLRLSQIPELIMDEPFAKDEYPEFLGHSHDIAILAMYYLKNKEIFKNKICLVNDSILYNGAYFHRRKANHRVSLTGQLRFLDQDEDFQFNKRFVRK